MRTLILCGGKGTRAYPHTLEIPKPLMEVDDRPILHHLMEIFAAQGFTDFLLAGGYKLPVLESFARELDEDWEVEVVDTGPETNTGGRVFRCADLLGEEFFCTYGDGLGDVDLAALVDFHRSHDGVATLTTVPLPSQYGTIDVGSDGSVSAFREKPQLPDHLINAGFFVFDHRAFDAWPDPGEDLEREVLPALGEEGSLFAYRHDGFWKSMDTYKDAQELTELARQGAPWTIE